MYNYLLGWKLKFLTEKQQSCSKAAGGGGRRLGWDRLSPLQPGVQCSFWASGWWGRTASACSHWELSGALGSNRGGGPSSRWEWDGSPHWRGRSCSSVPVTAPHPFPCPSRSKRKDPSSVSALVLSRLALHQDNKPQPSSEQQGSSLAAQLASFEAPSTNKKKNPAETSLVLSCLAFPRWHKLQL